MLETIPQASGITFSPVKKTPIKGRVVLGNITNTAHQRTPTRKGKASLVSPKKVVGALAKAPVLAPVLLAQPIVNEAPPCDKVEDKKVIRYDIDFLKSLRDLPICSVAPKTSNGNTPMDIITQYNEEYEKREALEREKQAHEFLSRCLQDLSIQSPKKVWRVKQPAKSPAPVAASEPSLVDVSMTELPMSPKAKFAEASFCPVTPSTPATPNPDSSVQDEDEDEKEPVDLERRLASRLKQISYGKNTQGYTNYLELVPREKRKRADPGTPDANQNCSKRSFDGQIRKWRRALHQFDDLEVATSARRKLVF